ncbi:RNA polymerase sigma-70 factor (ECF subfamily) [Aquimarina sp. MAR_2010_214]|uniref:RNA polymerase sigma factor n=1 Tax=Aquimarina sp. MAR_2010_214 TaxID=1250026 RepID=UPI000CB68B7E|nr:sigma-70 family RNA polymerase sigma factor [Aquimarina sp. MAR_2010_214]PKV53171.1 RNA polymerase sigma-70 factor (ECF subfamily) [Aquimarina sp. MAR_2010_214]
MMDVKKKSVCEEKTFKMIFDNHSEVIRNFIYYKCGDMQQAEDITQDAFVKLWKNCSKVIFEKAKSFVMKVAQNAFYNEVNHKKVILKYNQQAAPILIDGQSPEFLIEEKEFMLKLQQSISELPVKQREVFLLSRKDKKTYKEIAEIIGLTQKAVERRMHLALKELHEKLGDYLKK